MKAPRHRNKLLNTNDTKYLAHFNRDLNLSCYVHL